MCDSHTLTDSTVSTAWCPAAHKMLPALTRRVSRAIELKRGMLLQCHISPNHCQRLRALATWWGKSGTKRDEQEDPAAARTSTSADDAALDAYSKIVCGVYDKAGPSVVSIAVKALVPLPGLPVQADQ